MTTLTRRQKLRALAEAHDAWVERHLTDVSVEFEPRETGSDYNQHNIDIDADGTAEDEFTATAAKILGVSEPLTADAAFEDKHPRDGEGQFTDGGSDSEMTNFAEALTGQAALDAAPATLKRAPLGQRGNYEGEELTAPAGVGKVRALSEYQGLEYDITNTFLRGGLTSQSSPGNLGPEGDDSRKFTEKAARIVEEIDKTLAVSPLASDVRVERVIRYGARAFGNNVWYGDMNLELTDDFDEQDRLYERWERGERPDLTGLRWVDHGYQSTTAREGYAEEFGDKWREYNHFSEGEPVILNILVPAGTRGVQLSELEHEAEILLERGLVQEVVRDHGVGADGFRRLDVRVVGRYGDS